MKKFICFPIILMLLFSYAYADGQSLRVGIYFGDTAKETVTVNGVLYSASELDDSVTLTSDGGLISVDKINYRGDITLYKDSNGLITVINTVDTESYVASVLAKEMSPSFETEALKAQAVAARTYAIKKLNKHKAYGFDVCNGIDCQVYGGADAEHENTITAANDTAGQTLTYNGELIEAVYFASSGGSTESAVNVWGTDHKYLQAVDDRYEAEDVYGHSWEKELSPEKAAQLMQEHGYEIGSIKEIRIDERSAAGSVTKLTVVGETGEKTFTRESCRNIFAAYTLSQAYEITPPSTKKIYACNGAIDSSSLHLLSADGVTDYNASSICINGQRTTLVGNDSYIITGRGYGHLVGMSQNGANGMAKAGFTYKQILQYYYKGTEIN